MRDALLPVLSALAGTVMLAWVIPRQVRCPPAEPATVASAR